VQFDISKFGTKNPPPSYAPNLPYYDELWRSHCRAEKKLWGRKL